MPATEKRRFFEARGEKRDEWLVFDGKRHPPRVICKCVGWNAPKNAALFIAAALEAHNSKLYSKFTLGGSALPSEQLAVEAPDEAESEAAHRRLPNRSSKTNEIAAAFAAYGFSLAKQIARPGL